MEEWKELISQLPGTLNTGARIYHTYFFHSISNGKYILEDRFATDYAEPAVDDIQNLDLIDVIADKTQTTVVYSRSIKSCDADQDVPLLPGVSKFRRNNEYTNWKC